MPIVAPRRVSWFCLFAAAALVATAGSIAAQCGTPWVPNGGLSGCDYPVTAALVWDPDGSGPASSQLVLGGSFQVCGNARASNIVMRDLVTGSWSALGSGVTGSVTCLAGRPNGELIVGGALVSAGGMPVSHLAVWDGTTWSALGSGVSGAAATVLALATMPNGDVVVGGSFAAVDGVSAANIARWNGSVWSPLGAGTGAKVTALQVLPNGDLVAGGSFLTAGGVAASAIARWDGAAWSPLGAGLTQPIGILGVACMTLASNGDLFVGGDFKMAGGVNTGPVARWDGVAWSLAGAAFGSSMRPYAMAATTSGELITSHSNTVLRWDGSTWTTLLAMGGVWTLVALPGGGVVAGGGFVLSAPATAPATGQTFAADRVAQWKGAWSSLAPSWWSDSPFTLAATSDGAVLAGGNFTTTPDGQAHRVARWNGSSWSALGAGFNDSVNVCTTLASGEIVAGGFFTTSGSTQTTRIARWNGVSWLPFASTVSDTVNCILPTGGSTFVMGGAFTAPANRIARWNGSAWSALGSGMDGPVTAIAPMPNGDLIAVGIFTTAGGQPANGVARWNGTAWSPLGTGMVGWQTFDFRGPTAVVMPNGDVVVGGTFSTAGGVPAQSIARWDGAGWHPLGSGVALSSGVAGSVNSLLVLPNGDLLVGGIFATAGGVTANGIARWDGTSWSVFGSGTFATPAYFHRGQVSALAQLPDGDVLVSGHFLTVDGAVSPYLSRLTTTCPATATSFAGGCPSSGGANVLSAATLPWVDSTMRTRATGVPMSAIVVAVTGFASLSPAFPLDAVFPAALPGCDLHVDPLILQAQLTTTGTADSLLPLPNTPPLVGVAFHQQWVVIEVDAFLNFLEVTSTNALRFLAGDF